MSTVAVQAEHTESNALRQDELDTLSRYRRAANYLAAAQVYLKDNVLLAEPLRAEHIKDRLLGHWGTCPGINLICAHMNRLINRTGSGWLLVTGPGHGAAANLANMYLDGSLAEYYPEMTHCRDGLHRFVRAFSWPEGFPSHLFPGLPGVINEGGELGYSLAVAFGAVFDNPDLAVACIVGDGEAETGALAASWQSIKFINAATDGAVLPILHLNGFKISSPTLFATMSDEEIRSFFTGHGYQPRIVQQLDRIDEEMAEAMDWADAEIRRIQSAARTGSPVERPPWPMIVLKTPKGWTGPVELDGRAMVGSFRSHQVPGKDLRSNPEHLRAVEQWLKSYRPGELFDSTGRPATDILASCPRGELRVAMNPHGFGGQCRKPLARPSLHDFAIPLTGRGQQQASSMATLGGYLRELIKLNEHARNFRIVCPDELESNRLGEVLDVTARQYTWPLPEHSEKMACDGRVLEVLSEHLCQGWLQGYLLTGRHGLFPCYEAFVAIVGSMMTQYAKFLKMHLEFPWRKPLSSLNYILTSEAWRQDHNGYSHQGPGFINTLLTKKGHIYRIYLPPDANTTVSVLDHCLRKTNEINLLVAGKQPMPQWLSMDEAIEHNRAGGSIWRWACTNGGEDPQVVLCGCGDSLTLEVMAAAQMLRQVVPDWRVRVVNITRLMVLGIPQKYPPGWDEDQFQRIFPLDVPVIFNFHGYTAAVKQLLWERPQAERFDINGYREEGTTTTPFDMQVRNRTSRYHLVMQAARKIAALCPGVSAEAEEVHRLAVGRLREHGRFIVEHGRDPDEITNWKWAE